MKRNNKIVLIVFGAIVVAVAALIGFRIYMGIKMGSMPPPPETITSAIATEQSWQDEFKGVGSLASVKGATLAAEESGRVARINFESGTRVAEGDVLVELDTSVEEANLKGAEAMKARMERAFARAQTLRQKNAISSDEFDNTSAQYQQSISQADSLAATIKRKRIVAPFAGIAGIRTVNVGDYVLAGKLIVPLYAIDELFVNFMIPQQLAAKIQKGLSITVRSDADPSKEFSGTVTAVNPNIDEMSRNFSVQGTMRNTEGFLKPGMFADISVKIGDAIPRLTIPITCVQFAPYGDSVFILEKKEDGTTGVRQQFVKLGSRRGDQIAVLSGLRVGEAVASSGLFKLHPNVTVNINNSVTPSDKANPSPQNT